MSDMQLRPSVPQTSASRVDTPPRTVTPSPTPTPPTTPPVTDPSAPLGTRPADTVSRPGGSEIAQDLQRIGPGNLSPDLDADPFMELASRNIAPQSAATATLSVDPLVASGVLKSMSGSPVSPSLSSVEDDFTALANRGLPAPSTASISVEPLVARGILKSMSGAPAEVQLNPSGLPEEINHHLSIIGQDPRFQTLARQFAPTLLERVGRTLTTPMGLASLLPVIGTGLSANNARIANLQHQGFTSLQESAQTVGDDLAETLSGILGRHQAQERTSAMVQTGVSAVSTVLTAVFPPAAVLGPAISSGISATGPATTALTESLVRGTSAGISAASGRIARTGVNAASQHVYEHPRDQHAHEETPLNMNMAQSARQNPSPTSESSSSVDSAQLLPPEPSQMTTENFHATQALVAYLGLGSGQGPESRFTPEQENARQALRTALGATNPATNYFRSTATYADRQDYDALTQRHPSRFSSTAQSGKTYSRLVEDPPSSSSSSSSSAPAPPRDFLRAMFNIAGWLGREAPPRPPRPTD
ncbi:MAG: hypothetical protein ACAI44_18255 [Candidatus Sericytochromatia bacterium]